MLGGVFLCVTGAEALYADMGHFGKTPIRLAWSAIVFPSLVLNYAGQAAIVLRGAPIADNIFYRLCPPPLLLPLVVLATVATIIASQSIITGAFSMTRQAIQLGWLPRLHITQTSEEGYGQIYVGAVNWLLMVATIGLTLSVRQVRQSRRRLRHRGVADHADDLVPAVHRHARDLGMESVGQRRPRRRCSSSSMPGFSPPISLKIADGGYVPLLLAAAVYGLMLIWHRGTAAVARRRRADAGPGRRISWPTSRRATCRACPGPRCFSPAPPATCRR